jgi:hypothetical protein
VNCAAWWRGPVAAVHVEGEKMESHQKVSLKLKYFFLSKY